MQENQHFKSEKIAKNCSAGPDRLICERKKKDWKRMKKSFWLVKITIDGYGGPLD